MPTPDFLIVGAMKCGTSTLQAQLAAQDGVFMTTPKEPNFFSDDPIYAKGLEWYKALYDQAPSGDVTGEASTHYTKLPTYPKTLERMQASLHPMPRIIYMIRNPLERAVSHYIHEWTEARMCRDPIVEFQRHPEIIDYSRYGMQIAPYIEAAGAQKVLLTSLEQIKQTPDAEFARIAKFLDLPEGAAWRHDMSAQNVSAERARRLPMQGLLIDNPVARVLRQRLVPKAFRTHIRNKLTMKDRPTLPPALVADLKDILREDHTLLSRLFPQHPALSLCYPFIRP